MATLYTEQSKNIGKTWLLMGVFLSFVVVIGYFASIYWDDQSILYFAVLFSIAMNIGSYWFSDKIALSMAKARELKSDEHRDIWNITENLSITAGLPMPKLYIIDDPALNAFATGRNKHHSAIAITSGLLNHLNKSELEGVIAHEMAHIGNRDILLQSVVVVLVGAIAMLADMVTRSMYFGGRDRERNNIHPLIMIIGLIVVILSPVVATLIQLAISRKREFLADATGALITRYPEGLASALEKISDYHHPMKKVSNATAHMFIVTPFGGDRNNDGISDRHQKVSFIQKLFMTHPPVQDRIKALVGK